MMASEADINAELLAEVLRTIPPWKAYLAEKRQEQLRIQEQLARMQVVVEVEPESDVTPLPIHESGDAMPVGSAARAADSAGTTAPAVVPEAARWGATEGVLPLEVGPAVATAPGEAAEISQARPTPQVWLVSGAGTGSGRALAQSDLPAGACEEAPLADVADAEKGDSQRDSPAAPMPAPAAGAPRSGLASLLARQQVAGEDAPLTEEPPRQTAPPAASAAIEARFGKPTRPRSLATAPSPEAEASQAKQDEWF